LTGTNVENNDMIRKEIEKMMNIKRYLIFLLSFIIFISALYSKQTTSYLTRHDPKLVPTKPETLVNEEINGVTEQVVDETSTDFEKKYISLAEANRISSILMPTTKYNNIYHIPKKNNYFLLSAWNRNDSQEDYGQRFFLLKKDKTYGYVIQDKTRGAMDGSFKDPIYYYNSNKIIFIAETGDPDNGEWWGFDVYELKNDKILLLDSLNMTSTDSDGYNCDSIIKTLRVKESNNKLYLEIYTDTTYKKDQNTSVNLKYSKDKPILFLYDKDKFILQNQ